MQTFEREREIDKHTERDILRDRETERHDDREEKN